MHIGKRFTLAAAILGGTFFVGLADLSGQPVTSILRVKVDGAAHGYAGDCPLTLPALPTTCREVEIGLFREVHVEQTGGNVLPPKTPWHLFLLRHTLLFAGDGTEPRETNAAFAFVEVTDVTFDPPHLSAASVNAENVALDDGSTLTLNASWRARSPTRVYGNNSPTITDKGASFTFTKGA